MEGTCVPFVDAVLLELGIPHGIAHSASDRARFKN